MIQRDKATKTDKKKSRDKLSVVIKKTIHLRHDAVHIRHYTMSKYDVQ